MSTDKANLLNEFMSALPDQSLDTVTQAVERARLSGGRELPYEMVLEGLRPALRRADNRVPRTPSPLRLFCRPFEDLLFPGIRQEKQRGRIARSSIMPVWDWLASDLLPGRIDVIIQAVTDAILTDNARALRDSVMQMHGICGLAITKMLETAPKGQPAYMQLATRLGGELVLEDARDMAFVLEIADDINALLDDLPRPIASLTDEEIARVRQTYDVVSTYVPSSAPYAVFVTLGRLEKPWQILKILSRITNRDDDLLAASTDLSDVGALLFADLENAAAFFTSLDPEKAEVEDIVHQLTFFVQLSNGLTFEMGIRREGEWGQALASARTTVSDKMVMVIKRSVRQVLAALPSGNLQGSAFSAPVCPEAHGEAVRYARLLAEIRYLAEPGAFSGAYTGEIAEYTQALEAHIAALTQSVRDAKGDTEAVLESHVALALELAPLGLGEEEAELVARRLKSARAAA